MASGTKGYGKRFCSWDCYRPNKKIVRVCIGCGKPFEIYPSRDKKYCSHFCSTRPRVQPKVEDVDPAFGNWLAGLIDGEGGFSITRSTTQRSKRYHYMPRMALGLRDDDEEVLREVAATLKITTMLHRERSNHGSRPQIQIDWMGMADLLTLVSVLDKYPLRSKKRRAYEIWRECVMLKNDGKPHDEVEFIALRERLIASHAYQERKVGDA